MTGGLEPGGAEGILAQARARGVDVVLTEAGGLELLSAGAPPPDIVTLIKRAKPEVVSRLAMERRMVDRWVNDHLIDWDPNHCLHCRQRFSSARRGSMSQATSPERVSTCLASPHGAPRRKRSPAGRSELSPAGAAAANPRRTRDAPPAP